MEYPPIPHTAQLPVQKAAPPICLTPLPDVLTSPPPLVPNSKSVYAFWDKGIHNLYPNVLRNVVAWHHRLSHLGWNIYVFDVVPDSPLNITNFLDIADPNVVPDAFRDGTLSGEFKGQHLSDLIRFPLLLKYGGVYMDVGIMLFGDLEGLWTRHIMNPESPFDFAGFTFDLSQVSILSYLLISNANNPLVARAHHLLLKVWEGKTSTQGMHKDPLISHISFSNVPSEFDTNGDKAFSLESLLDYAIHMHVIRAAQSWVDEEDGWDGPQYVQDRCYVLSMMEYSHAHERLASWNGELLHRLFLLPLPRHGKDESEDQKLARQITEEVAGKAWCLKLGHEAVGKLSAFDSLGVCWRDKPGTDCVKGTYGGWLRWAEWNLGQNRLPDTVDIPMSKPSMKGRLLPRS
ncbi:hypothetical protein FB567DRAFT_618422 [Paraphoma chrysanthemicola]|uniref:Capsule polysaccharide biosynthesis protein n=1 Tax=Paraphoma chrysanthemicola TaxID=798071 RepID=A0A8K0W193_9PLEO|nr:hypothetical protein FB567DRAFT_618422 [Paraphoma chrysanthemicola]